MPEVKYDALYREDPSVCGDPLPAFVAYAEATGGPGVRVLDLGCGQGRDALVFARRGCSVVGIDVSAVGIEQLRATAHREGLDIHVMVGDVRDLGHVGEFDVVVLDRVLHMLASDEARRAALASAMASTRSGGAVLVVDEPKNQTLLREAFVASGWQVFDAARDRTFARKPSV